MFVVLVVVVLMIGAAGIAVLVFVSERSRGTAPAMTSSASTEPARHAPAWTDAIGLGLVALYAMREADDGEDP